MTPETHRPPATATDTGPDSLEGGKTPDLLLADHGLRLAKKVGAHFAGAGVRTLVCHDGAEALLQVGAHHPKAVLLGAPLPVVNAAQVTEPIAKLHPVPVIVGAGPEGAAEATAALSAGAVAFVARPLPARGDTAAAQGRPASSSAVSPPPTKIAPPRRRPAA